LKPQTYTNFSYQKKNGGKKDSRPDSVWAFSLSASYPQLYT